MPGCPPFKACLSPMLMLCALCCACPGCLQYLVDICMTEVGSALSVLGAGSSSLGWAKGAARGPCMLHHVSAGCTGWPAACCFPACALAAGALHGTTRNLLPTHQQCPLLPICPCLVAAEEGVGVPQGGRQCAARIQAPLCRLRQLRRAAVRRVPAPRPADCGCLRGTGRQRCCCLLLSVALACGGAASEALLWPATGSVTLLTTFVSCGLPVVGRLLALPDEGLGVAGRPDLAICWNGRGLTARRHQP